MAALLSLVVVVVLSLLVTRVATTALVHTGLSREVAKFQARSAFTGVGFTTRESEKVVGHPVRRRVVLLLMLLGNAGFITALASLVLTFVNESFGTTLLRVGILLAALAAIWRLAASRFLDRRIERLIVAALRRFTDLDVADYASLLHVNGPFGIGSLRVSEGDWVAHKTLAESRLRHEGAMVLGVERADGSYVGAPDGTTEILPGDELVLYGRDDVLRGLDDRLEGLRGDAEHAA